ncbi:NAD-dependent deacylase [Marinimicrobium sp. ABcell2]|uniref:SIR2 family NAD-dependent protein deacylase n=1 Tax=Marinimicrobium sp. ABcell2 TaxID=3069751 RepID=UPI0027B81D12|nr:NAD-dependent deacylase [Marinimicrobium sp. ABcell2]MDQ2076619.1 NAD-dependent deacylase [Marinimicrobium sp. ABcell2]
MKKHIVVLTGAGISAESGLGTFRASDGLWERHRIEDVATPEGFQRDPERVLQFYNERRDQLRQAEPNAAHFALVELESSHRVTIITQNIDDLHERAGSSHIVHLHGELTKACSSQDVELIYDIGYQPIELGGRCELGSQLRPFVVWFGESVPMLERAAELVAEADHLLVVGTSLQVYPAAGLVEWAGPSIPITVIDPGTPAHVRGANVLRKRASEGVPAWVEELRARVD